jgi:hypothetical protein
LSCSVEVCLYVQWPRNSTQQGEIHLGFTFTPCLFPCPLSSSQCMKIIIFKYIFHIFKYILNYNILLYIDIYNVIQLLSFLKQEGKYAAVLYLEKK